MSYKIFLLEKELGYQIHGDMCGVVVIERLSMLDRYWEDKKKQDEKSSKGIKSKGRGLVK